MERGRKSAERSGVLVKIRNSSGCMIVKKKSDGSDRIGYSECKKAKKSSGMVLSDSGSSDEILTPPRRRIDPETIRVCNGLAGSRKDSFEKSEFGRKRDRAELFGSDENGFVGTSNCAEPGEGKKNRLDVFEFDEYDGFDVGMMMRKRFDGGGRSSLGFMSAPRGGTDRQHESGSSRDAIVERRKKSCVNDSDRWSLQEKYASDSDSEEPIRVQGKNGVLKVMVSKKKKMDGSFRNSDHLKVKRAKSGSRFQRTIKKNISVRSLNHLEAEFFEEPCMSSKTAKSGKNMEKSLITKRRRRSQDSDSEQEDSEMSTKFEEKKVESHKLAKRVNSKLDKSLPEQLRPAVTKDGKTRRGSGTEKQRLREQIRGMLHDAGWTIDYRPRKNRDYMDAVYVNPTGTAFWSIIKAYEALLKQLDDEAGPSKDGSAFASISEEILNKLTRKTRNRIKTVAGNRPKDASDSDGDSEQDLAQKGPSNERNDEGSEDSDMHEEKLSSFVKQGRKFSRKKIYGETDLGINSKSTSSLYHRDERASSGSNTHKLHGRKSNKLGRCTLLVRSSNEGKNSEIDGFVPYYGKRTLLSWLIDTGMAQLSQKVKYMNRRRTRVMLEGWITREGIHCGCCSKILTITKFEIHAGSKLRQPFQNIYLDSGVSLLQCQIDAWNMQEDAKHLGFHHVDTDGCDPNDDTCSLCGDGGDLICCDGCPSTFHQSCLGIQTLPTGDWHCPNCTCKICSAAVGNTILEEEETILSLLSCRMCGGKYHKSCISEVGAFQADSIGSVGSFCGQTCLELSENLQKYLGVKNEIEAGFSWSLIHRVDEDSDSSAQALAERVETNSKLAVALTIMDECFLPIVDRRSGINLIRNILYNCGSNFNRLNYSGFYTAVLERGDEIICAASIRFHGTRLVEMPFIGTRHIYRRQGMCRRLFNAIELAMQYLKIEKMAIPAIPDFMDAWIEHFGFSPLEDSLKKEMRFLNMLVFPGIDMLQKQLLGQENDKGAVGSDVGSIVPNVADDPVETVEKAIECPVSDDKTVSSVFQPPDELPKPSSEREYLSTCSANLTAKKFEDELISGSPVEEDKQVRKNGKLGNEMTNSSSDMNLKYVEADANSFSLETQVSAEGAACCSTKLGNEMTNSSSDMNLPSKSDMTLDASDAKIKLLLDLPAVEVTRCCEDFKVRDADGGKLDVAAAIIADQVSMARSELADEKSVSDKKPTADENSAFDDKSTWLKESESDEKPASHEELTCDEKPAFGEKSVLVEKPAGNEKSTCNEEPASDEKPAPDEIPGLDEKPAREKSDERPISGEKPASEKPVTYEKPESDKKPACDKKPSTSEKSECDEQNMETKEVFLTLDGNTAQSLEGHVENGCEADVVLDVPVRSQSGDELVGSALVKERGDDTGSWKEKGAGKDAAAFMEHSSSSGEMTSESVTG